MSKQQKNTAAEINKEFIEGKASELHKAADKLKEATRAYFADLEARKAALSKQGADCQEVYDDAMEQRRELAEKIADLTSRGQVDEAAGEYEKLEAMDKEILKIGRKLRLLQNAEVKGDPTLYNAAKTAQDAVHSERTKYTETIKALSVMVREEQKRLEGVEFDLSRTYPGTIGAGADDEFVKVERHFKDLDRVQQEAREKAKAAREAAERDARIVRIG